MKFLVAILALIVVTTKSEASVKLPGTAVFTLCSSHQGTPAEVANLPYTITSVCFGHIAGNANETRRLFKVLKVSYTVDDIPISEVVHIWREESLNGGINPSFGASTLTLKDMNSPQVSTANKHTVGGAVTALIGATPRGIRFYAVDFKRVATQQ